MPGGEAAVANPSFEFTGSPESEGALATDERAFDAAWRDILLDARESNLRTDIERRHAPATFENVLPLAAANPERVSITREPVGRNRDMATHVRSDIGTLLDTDHFVHRFVRPVPRTEALLKLFELGYIYDAAGRFCPEIVVSPGTEGLEELRFIELPGELEAWMGRVDVLWGMAAGDIPTPEDRDLDAVIESLYAERHEFIERARGLDTFLPIPPADDGRTDPGRLASRIGTRLGRNGRVAPDLVFEYCYNTVIDY
jgi:hypothetical protein